MGNTANETSGARSTKSKMELFRLFQREVEYVLDGDDPDTKALAKHVAALGNGDHETLLARWREYDLRGTHGPLALLATKAVLAALEMRIARTVRS